MLSLIYALSLGKGGCTPLVDGLRTPSEFGGFVTGILADFQSQTKLLLYRNMEKNTVFIEFEIYLLSDPEVTTNIYCKLCNLPNTDTKKYSTYLR